ncbi:MAG: vWA domain-containing protein [Gemmataceae bacterium]
MPAPKMLSGLPKPLLFGLYGAIGGLLGALLFGEPVWALLKPPPPLPPDPQVAVSASATVQVYAKSENTFPVRIVRERFEGQVTVTFATPPAFKIAPLTIAADKTEGIATITVDASATPGETPLLLTAQGSNGVSSSSSIKVQVLPTPPPPPALAVAVPPTLAVYKKGTGRFTVSVARRGYDGPISVVVENLPEGVKAAPATIPEEGTETDVTLTAADTTALGTAPLTVSVEATTGKLKAATPTQLIVSNPPIAPVDIVFVLDVTASMQWAIDDLKNGIGKFADTLTKNQLNFRLGLVTFRDLSRPDESVDVIEFKPREVFTNDAKVVPRGHGHSRHPAAATFPKAASKASSRRRRCRIARVRRGFCC